ncbi:20818_t:CDS:1, partial [Gigaspora rosea]
DHKVGYSGWTPPTFETEGYCKLEERKTEGKALGLPYEIRNCGSIMGPTPNNGLTCMKDSF